MTTDTRTLPDSLGDRQRYGYRYFENEPITPGEILEYRFDVIADYESVPDSEAYYLPELLSGSDYAGGSMTVANYRSFMGEFEDVDGVHAVTGGHRTYAVAIRADALTDAMIEVFRSLDDYPVIDEEEWSNVESEAEAEAWESWAASGFRYSLICAFPESEDAIDDIDEDTLREIFEAAREDANEYWINETGNQAWINTDIVASHAVLPGEGS